MTINVTNHLESSCFNITVENFIATVEINRPPVNAQNSEFRLEIAKVFDELGDRNDVRAIVLTGAGKTFSAGADLKERPSDEPGAYTLHNRRVRASFDCVYECKKPVIAAVNGAAIGAGCVLALCCDIVLAADTAFLSMTEVNVGLAGGVSHVRRHFGESNARLMIMTAQRVYGPELVQKNVASHSVPLEQLMPLALEIATEIASKSPSAVSAAKKSFLTTENLSLKEGYLFEQSQTESLATSEDTQEALAAFSEKRKPVFK